MKWTRIAMLVSMALALAAVISACANSNGLQPGPGTAEGSHVLTVEVEGPGAVAIPELGETCRDSCTVTVGAGVDLELQPQADGGKGFVRWEQACTGNGDCTVRMDSDATVRAVFADHVLGLDMRGDGAGTVRIVPPDANCSEDCSIVFPSAMNASLTVTLAEGSFVKGWGGDCSGTGTSRQCQVAISARTNVSLTLINPPVATGDSYSVEEDETLAVPASSGVLSNDSDSGGESLSAVLVSSAKKGDLDLASNGSFTYQPAPGATGGDSFTYRARDESGNLSEAVGVSIMITAKDRFPLEIRVGGPGKGTVTSSPGGIACTGGTCSETFVEGQSVTLTAQAGEGSEFDGWGGACSGTSSTCTVQMSADRSVTANFSPLLVLLSYEKAGDGAGTVYLQPPGKNCTSSCSQSYEYGEEITLTAEAGAQSKFAGWGGDCQGQSKVCALPMKGDRSVTATFQEQAPPPPEQLTLSVTVSEGGSVTSNPAGISCNPDCEQTYDKGQDVTLTAHRQDGYTFAGWSGDCSGSEMSCVVPMDGDSDKSVTARFEPEPPPTPQYTLSVSSNGPGRVTSADSGISCNPDCAQDYQEDTPVELTAHPDAGSQFDGWGGSCATSTSDTCMLVMNSDKDASASFSKATVFHQASVTLAGSGSGRVTSEPPGIDCISGGDSEQCSESYEKGTQLELTAAAQEGSEFVEWSKPCSGQGTCQFELRKDESVTATFEPRSWLVEVDPVPSGGTVSSDGGEIACGEAGSKCSAEYQHGTDVLMTATPTSDHEFASWTGACAGQEGTSCSLKITKSEALSATFDAVADSSEGSSSEDGSSEGGVTGGSSGGDTSGGDTSTDDA